MIQSLLVVGYTIGVLVLSFWMVRAQQRYLRILDDRDGTQHSIEMELDHAAVNPLRAFLTSPRRSALRMRALSEVQRDPYIERARQECVRRRLVFVTFFIGGLALLAALTFM